MNALSEKLTVEVQRDGCTWTQAYERGKPLAEAQEGQGHHEDRHEDHVLARPRDLRRRPSSSSARSLAERLQELAFLNKGVEIVLTDERDEPRRRSSRPRAASSDFVKYLAQGKEAVHRVIPIESKGDDGEVEVAMQWNTGYTESFYSFANTINTHEGGMHEEGFKKALTNVLNRWARRRAS